MSFKIRVGDEILNSSENLVGIVMEEHSDSFLVNITTEDHTKSWSKFEVRAWRQAKFNKAAEAHDKKNNEKMKVGAVSTPIIYRKVSKHRDN